MRVLIRGDRRDVISRCAFSIIKKNLRRFLKHMSLSSVLGNMSPWTLVIGTPVSFDTCSVGPPTPLVYFHACLLGPLSSWTLAFLNTCTLGYLSPLQYVSLTSCLLGHRLPLTLSTLKDYEALFEQAG